MTEDSPSTHGSALSLTVTVSSQPAFMPTVEALAARVGEFVGCGPEAARQLGEAVRRALDGALHQRALGRAPGRFDIVFQGNGRLLRVDLAAAAPLPAGVTLEEALGGEDVVAGLRELVDRVEFGDTGGGPYCRLTRQIRDAH